MHTYMPCQESVERPQASTMQKNLPQSNNVHQLILPIGEHQLVMKSSRCIQVLVFVCEDRTNGTIVLQANENKKSQ